MDEKQKTPERIPPGTLARGLLFWLLAGLVLLALMHFSQVEGKRKEISYSAFIQEVQQGNVSMDEKDPVRVRDPQITGTLKDGTKFSTVKPQEDQDVYRILRESNVPFKIEQSSDFMANLLLAVVPAILIFGLLWYMLSRQMNADGNRMMSFARSRPVTASAKNKTTFADVAGSEEEKEELREIIDFLKDPQKFQKLGGKIPRGVLLIGPPGTGKTLLARAVAGEADVPFLSMSGSDFVEMFVGVGAARVRDLFRQARRVSPSILFIDEIDAVGRQRFAGLGGGHDEREQTLNQLLVEMDGFQPDEGIILIAATNRPDVLDPALTRPGRFDRTVVVNLPDIREREAILKVHTRNKPLDPSISLQVLARGTPGLSGADLANIVNEAALLAARKNKQAIDMTDLEAAKDKIFMGVEHTSLLISEEEKKIIAYHEAGHTLVQKSLPEVYPVHKVTIIPRGKALGLTHILPERDHFIESNSYYRNSIVTLLAGRAAELLVFNRMYTGSQNDLRVATDIARQMVCEWGMSEKLGPVSYRHNDAVFLGRDLVQPREHSEDTSREIDEEVRRMLEEGARKASDILLQNREKLDLLATTLLEKETLSAEELDELLGRTGLEDKDGPHEPTENRNTDQTTA